MDKCIIFISHSNYLFCNAGTEKLMRELKTVFNEKKIHIIQIFSFEKYSKIYNICDMSKKIGVNYDDKFLGIYEYKDLITLFSMIEKKYKIGYVGIHLHNLLNHNIGQIEWLIKKSFLPVILWLHDYTILCPKSPILFRNNKECCNNFKREIRKCYGCIYGKNIQNDWLQIDNFFKSIDKQLKYIIAPSENVKKNISISFKFWEKRIIVRSHWIFASILPIKILKPYVPIKIAFVGGKFEHKGIVEWNKLVSVFANSNEYELYYLGSNVYKNSKEKNIYVNVATQGENAMVEALKKHDIDVAFLWSKCQETYSYTYYEVRSAGTRVVCYKNSGNIADSVKKDKSGLVFNNIDNLIQLMYDSNKFRMELSTLNNKFFSKYEKNNYIENIDLNEKNRLNNNQLCKCKRFLTIIYYCSSKVKYFKARLKELI